MSLFNYECDEVKQIIDEVSPNYPQLTTYEKEWIFFHKYHYIPGVPVELECQEVIVNPMGTVQNAIPYPYKRAILKGNTIVSHYSSGIVELTANGSWVESPVALTQITLPIKPSTDYLFVVEIMENSLIGDETINNSIRFGDTEGTGRFPTVFKGLKAIPLHQIGMCRFILTTKANIDNINLFDRKQLSKHCTSGKIKFRYAVIECQQGMENWDIPYFEGMKSVQMPVLTTSNGDGTKTNILTVNEEVELRGIGDVKDELNLLTGELTQRIDKNNEVLAQAVVKTVGLTKLNKPYEGTNHYHLTATIPCEVILEVPVVSTGEQTLQEINNY